MRDGSWGYPRGPSRTRRCAYLFLLRLARDPVRRSPGEGWRSGNLETWRRARPASQISSIPDSRGPPRYTVDASPRVGPSESPGGASRGASRVPQSGPLRGSRGAGMGAPMGCGGGHRVSPRARGKCVRIGGGGPTRTTTLPCPKAVVRDWAVESQLEFSTLPFGASSFDDRESASQ
jgi:hypothetical protein